MKRTGESGFALMLVFLMAAVIAISLYSEIPRVSFESQRAKEEMLIERGEQYERAIKVFVKKMNRYPASIDELENTQNVRFLRKRYTDPMTGKDDWRLVHVGPGGVFTDSLVYKTSDKDKEKKEANTNTFITEGPAIGATLGQGQQQQSAFMRRRRSEGGAAPGQQQIPGQQTTIPSQPYLGAPLPGSTDPNQPVAAAQPGAYPGAPVPGQPGYGAPGMPTYPGAPAPGQPGFGAPGMPSYPGTSVPGQPGYGAPGMPSYPGAPGTAQQIPGQPGYQAGMPAGMPVPGGAAPGQTGYPGAPVSSQTGGVSPYPYSTTSGSQGGAPYFPQPGMQPAAPGMVPNAQGGNDATRLIQSMLTSPRSASFAASGATTQSGMQIGGGIAGVASKLEDKGIKVYNDKENYNEWEFVYDMTKDRGLAGVGASAAPGTPAGQMGQAAGSGAPSTAGSPGGLGSSGFGSSSPFGSQSPFGGSPSTSTGSSPGSVGSGLGYGSAPPPPPTAPQQGYPQQGYPPPVLPVPPMTPTAPPQR